MDGVGISPLTKSAVFNMSGATCERERPLMVLRCLLTFQFMAPTNSDFTDDKQFFYWAGWQLCGGPKYFFIKAERRLLPDDRQLSGKVYSVVVAVERLPLAANIKTDLKSSNHGLKLLV